MASSKRDRADMESTADEPETIESLRAERDALRVRINEIFSAENESKINERAEMLKAMVGNLIPEYMHREGRFVIHIARAPVQYGGEKHEEGRVLAQIDFTYENYGGTNVIDGDYAIWIAVDKITPARDLLHVYWKTPGCSRKNIQLDTYDLNTFEQRFQNDMCDSAAFSRRPVFPYILLAMLRYNANVFKNSDNACAVRVRNGENLLLHRLFPAADRPHAKIHLHHIPAFLRYLMPVDFALAIDPADEHMCKSFSLFFDYHKV